MFDDVCHERTTTQPFQNWRRGSIGQSQRWQILFCKFHIWKLQVRGGWIAGHMHSFVVRPIGTYWKHRKLCAPVLNTVPKCSKTVAFQKLQDMAWTIWNSGGLRYLGTFDNPVAALKTVSCYEFARWAELLEGKESTTGFDYLEVSIFGGVTFAHWEGRYKCPHSHLHLRHCCTGHRRTITCTPQDLEDAGGSTKSYQHFDG